MSSKAFRERSEHNLDAKGRLNIPSRFLTALEEKESNVLIIAPWFDHLRAYPEEEWVIVEEKLTSGGVTDKRFANWVRFTLGALSEVTPDKQGRILISQTLRQQAKLQKEIVLTGMRKWFEIWDRPTILAKEAEMMGDWEAHQDTLATLEIF